MTTPQLETIQEICYPLSLYKSSCFVLPGYSGKKFELHSNSISQLPKFFRLDKEDAYILLHEFNDVCNMINIPDINTNAIKLRFISFALKNDAKSWMFTLPPNSIHTRVEFYVVFVMKFYPLHKTIQAKNTISNIHQEVNESFWKYFERFTKMLAKCPNHGINKAQQCQILYEGLNFPTKTVVESMCPTGFMKLNEIQAWDFCEELVEGTM